jgi:hypothetical protein
LLRVLLRSLLLILRLRLLLTRLRWSLLLGVLAGRRLPGDRRPFPD